MRLKWQQKDTNQLVHLFNNQQFVHTQANMTYKNFFE